jgi:uncharacterized protein (TIGR00156 family)
MFQSTPATGRKNTKGKISSQRTLPANPALLAAGIFTLCLALPVHAQGGFVDTPGESAAPRLTAIEDARKLRDDTPVQLQGQIVSALGNEKYLFRDASGEIIVEIDDDVWRGLTVGPGDRIEIRGEVDKDFPGFAAEIEVRSLQKFQN